MSREFWIVNMSMVLTKEQLLRAASGLGDCEAIHVREVVEGESQKQPEGAKEAIVWTQDMVNSIHADADRLGKKMRMTKTDTEKPDHSAEPADAITEIPKSVIDAVAEAVGADTYYCSRVWSAWGAGTMGPDDFGPLCEESDWLAAVALAAINSYRASQKGGA